MEDEYDNQEPEEWFEPELPDGTFYEDTIEDTENIYDTDEFDEIYSTYADAKQRLNQLRQSRGFYPVVAKRAEEPTQWWLLLMEKVKQHH